GRRLCLRRTGGLRALSDLGRRASVCGSTSDSLERADGLPVRVAFGRADRRGAPPILAARAEGDLRPGRVRLPHALLQPAACGGIPGTGHEGDDETGLTVRRRVRGRGSLAHAAGPRPRRPSSSCRPGPARTAGPRGPPTWQAVVGCGTRAIGIGPP